ncbi:uncharacterized protein HKW66_Vig0128410 [Vigna angularis]|nr:uncharacterized protein LOC108337122 isoform X3 [Vigna angularis]KAG2391398.1 uncharacterized protein HKW66_Vig0128410 [Vigna angularis]
MEFTYSFGSFSFYEYASPTKLLLWLTSIFSGIIFCLIAYTSTAVLSSLLIKGYGKLSSAEKIEWNNRGFSTFHALFVSSASFYLIFLSDVFNANSQEVVINKSSRLSDTVLGVLHHGLSIGSITLSLLSGQVHIYILMVLFSESTTPFVNLRWYLDIAGLKSSKLYIWNGISLFLGWLVARIFLFMFLFYHIWTHLVEVQEVFLFGFYTLIMVPSVLAVMNIFWFWKIAKGMVKTLTKAKHNKGA